MATVLFALLSLLLCFGSADTVNGLTSTISVTSLTGPGGLREQCVNGSVAFTNLTAPTEIYQIALSLDPNATARIISVSYVLDIANGTILNFTESLLPESTFPYSQCLGFFTLLYMTPQRTCASFTPDFVVNTTFLGGATEGVFCTNPSGAQTAPPIVNYPIAMFSFLGPAGVVKVSGTIASTVKPDANSDSITLTDQVCIGSGCFTTTATSTTTTASPTTSTSTPTTATITTSAASTPTTSTTTTTPAPTTTTPAPTTTTPAPTTTTSTTTTAAPTTTSTSTTTTTTAAPTTTPVPNLCPTACNKNVTGSRTSIVITDIGGVKSALVDVEAKVAGAQLISFTPPPQASCTFTSFGFNCLVGSWGANQTLVFGYATTAPAAVSVIVGSCAPQVLQ